MVGIGLFAPLPLAIMIPFMAGQSFAMGEAFGKGFQYGKRRVSSMTNEQFNASSAEAMFRETTADITKMIPSMKNAMSHFHTLQTDIILQMIEYISKLPADVLPEVISGAGNITQDLPNVLFDLLLQQLGITNPLPSAEARLDDAGIRKRYLALQDAIRNKKGADAIKALTWGLHLALKEPKNTFVGPPSPSKPSPSPSDTEIFGTEPDLRKPTHAFSNMPQGRFPFINRKAGQSQLREFRLLVSQIKKTYFDWVKVSPAVKHIQLKRLNELKQKLVDLIKRYGIKHSGPPNFILFVNQ